jgi:hypothetical protein
MVAEGLNILMSKTIIADEEFLGYGIGRDEDLNISHIQFSYDTIITRKRS